MPLEFLVPMLAMFTLGAGVVMAWRGSRKVERMREDDSVPPSALSKNGDDHKAQTDKTIGQPA